MIPPLLTCQNILSGLEEQYNTYKRQQQLESSRRQRVDVQLGRALLADVPQVGAVRSYGCLVGLGYKRNRW